MSIDDQIQGALAQVIKEAQERVMKKAMADFEEEIARSIGTIGFVVSRYFTYERVGPQITISVRDMRQEDK